MANLGYQRCYHHAQREAVVCCPACRRFFCRECVTEHDDRMLCSQCLARSAKGAESKPRPWLRAGILFLQGILGFVLLWCAFYLTGRILLTLPNSFHEGTIWETGWKGPE